MALAAYRDLWRATRLAFQGDARVLHGAREQIRSSFRQGTRLPASDPAALDAIKHAEEVAALLRHNLVQGRKEGDRYVLRIHEETERGDNDTIKLGGQSVHVGVGKTCKSAKPTQL